MPSRLNPYDNFRNTARQAMEVYKGVFGGHLDDEYVRRVSRPEG